MAKYVLTPLTADGRSTTVSLNSRRDGSGDGEITKTVFLTGTFGGGTATIQVSPDGGTTWVDALDSGLNVAAFTSDGYANITLQGTEAGAKVPALLSVDLASSSSPDLDITVFDNR